MELNSEDRKKLQKLQLEILLQLDEICDRNNVKYSLAYGTLLGAVRHEGFIPWDDDIDVYMLREEFIKFKKIINSCLSDDYFYQSHETDSEYYFSIDKIRINNTLFKEQALSDHNIHHGVYIDIFPIDNVPENKILEVVQSVEYALLRKIMNSKDINLKYRHGLKKVYAILIRIIFCFISKEKLFTIQQKVAMRYNDQKTKRVKNFWSNVIKRNTYKIECFTELEKIPFENYYFMASKHRNEMLQQFYGDFMKLPPKEQRKTVHDLEQCLF